MWPAWPQLLICLLLIGGFPSVQPNPQRRQALVRELGAAEGEILHLSLTHKFSHLLGSAHSARGGLGGDRQRSRGSASWAHAAMVRAHDRARHGRMLASNGGADFSLSGNANPQLAGLYWTEIGLGTPARPFKVQVDSGSDVTWVACQPCTSCASKSDITALDAPFDPNNSSTFSGVSCSNKLCNTLQTMQSSLESVGCSSTDASDSKCYYRLLYGDGSSTQGYYLQDRVHYTLLDGSQGSAPFSFGCGFNQSEDLLTSGQLVDGLMGLGRGPLSLVSQLAALGASTGAFAHCLGGEEAGGGTLLLGKVTNTNNSLRTTPMLDGNGYTYYFAQLDGISVGGEAVPGVDASSFGKPADRSGVLFDSGTTLSLWPHDVMTAWQAEVEARVTDLKVLDSSSTLGLYCWDFSSHSPEDLSDHFPNVTLKFDGADMDLGPENYIMLLSSGSGSLAACIGWDSSGQAGSTSSLSIIGDIIMRDKLMVFDPADASIGWMDFDCSTGTIHAQGTNSNVNVSIVVGSPAASHRLPVSSMAAVLASIVSILLASCLL